MLPIFFVGTSSLDGSRINFLLFFDISIGQDYLLAALKKEEDASNVLVSDAQLKEYIFLIDEDNRLVHDPTSPFEHPIRLSQPQAFISSETTGTRAIMTVTGQSSNIQSFYKLSAEERLRQVQQFAGLTDDELNALRVGGLSFDRAERMVENVVGVFPIPLGIATNFLINNKDYLVPMAIEEPSVVAAASHAAKMARQTGGFIAESTEPRTTTQAMPSQRNELYPILGRLRGAGQFD